MSKLLKTAIFVLAFLSLPAVSYASDVKTVKVTEDGVVKSFVTSAVTVGELLDREGIGFAYMDTLSSEMDETLKDNMSIVITRGYYVTVKVDSDRVDQVKVTSGLQAGYLIKRLQDERNVRYEYGGKLNQALQEGDVIELATVGKAGTAAAEPSAVEPAAIEPIAIEPAAVSLPAPAPVTTVEQVQEFDTIPFITEIMESADIAPGETQTVREGIAGERRYTYEISYTNGQETQRVLKADEITVWPVSMLVYQGVAVPAEGAAAQAHVGMIDDPSSLIGQQLDVSQLSYKSVHTMDASAYCADSPDKTTATGILPRHGIVAVDPSVIPLGTLLYIEGYGVALAADTGGSIKGYKIDLFYASYSEAVQFGRKDLTVYILS